MTVREAYNAFINAIEAGDPAEAYQRHDALAVLINEDPTDLTGAELTLLRVYVYGIAAGHVEADSEQADAPCSYCTGTGTVEGYAPHVRATCPPCKGTGKASS